MATFRRLPDEALIHHTPRWLMRQLDLVERARWDETVSAISATQVGVMRALALAFGKNKLDNLPTFDELQSQNEQRTQDEPAWMTKFEQANQSKAIR